MTLTHVVKYTPLSDDTDKRGAVYSTILLMEMTNVVQYTVLPDDTDTRSAIYSTPWWHWHT